MDANGPSEKARTVLVEVTESLRTPNPHNLEEALSLLRQARVQVRRLSDVERQALPDLDRTLADLRQLAEQTAAFYLGLAATVRSRSGSYNAAGKAALPSDCRSLSVQG